MGNDNRSGKKAKVSVDLSYYVMPHAGYAMIEFAGHTFLPREVVEIRSVGDEIHVPMAWFWQLFAPILPEVLGIKLDNAPVSYERGGEEPTTWYYADVSPLMEQLFEAVVDAAHQHSEHNQLRDQALRALRELQALGIIEIPVLFAHQYRGRIDGFKWPFVIISVEPVHALRLGGETRILAVNTEVVGFDINDAELFVHKPVVFELGALVDGQRRAVNVTVVA